ncbi:hypothetical protein ElyMa_001907700 [Elysia marginata]|uniref:Uncharacterized protein n=1 Tax=Elysia marginata TaxID=1093978 RepID=A0AAV4ESB7_9GAST|nr:hypothetical protein ElyMa_001907700 [Elysia marginata]
MTETVREVPLSLQVFHSHNEYKAHRRNRTEQIYLRDLSAGLGREEKLYVKEYAFQRSSFHRHYARRFSAPLLSAPSVVPSRAATAPTSAIAPTLGQTKSYSKRISRSASSSFSAYKNGGKSGRAASHASLFSASASLRHATASTNSSPLALRMLDGLKEVSVSTRFQRVQRKFSIASMTEHGCLTAEGDSLAENIQEVRKRLFKRGVSGTRKTTSMRDLISTVNSDNNRRDSITMVEEEGEETEDKATEVENSCKPVGLNTTKNIARAEPSFDNKDKQRVSSNTKDKDETPYETIPLKPNETNKDENVKTQPLEIDPRMKMPFLKLRASLNFTKQRNTRANNHVTISEPIPEDATSTDPEETVEEEPEPEEETPQHGLFHQQTSSIFKRFLSNTPYTEPLQLKIRAFLQDQAKFNHRFPKGQENSVDQSDRHKQLLSGEKEKKERQKIEYEKKKEIVFEVLTKLGITDEHIWFHYNQ